jgi:hypothetical protein
LVKALPPTFLLAPGMKNLSALLMKLKKLTDKEREKIKTQHQKYYQEHFSNTIAAQTLERHFKALIQVTKS